MRAQIAFILVGLAGCDAGFPSIDARVDALMSESSEAMGGQAPAPRIDTWATVTSSDVDLVDPAPETTNPAPDDLAFAPAPLQDPDAIADALDQAAALLEAETTPLPLDAALLWATAHSQEYESAEYDYMSACLSLLYEQHLWGPRFFDTITTSVDADADEGFYDSAITVVNDFDITHRLPYGGDVSAGVLATVVDDIHGTVTDDRGTSLTLDVSIPLLKGAGAVAREDLIQAKRDMVYAARTFERFRRSFLRQLVGDYLNLVVRRQALDNAQRGVESLRQLARRQQALYEAGRARLYDSADAENQALASIASLSQSWEQYRLAVDRFKVRIGWPVDDPVRIESASLGLVPPAVTMGEAVTSAMTNRLDLQTEADELEDAERSVQNARNALLPNLTLTAGIDVASDDDTVTSFDAGNTNLDAGLSLEVPLDRKREGIIVRQAQITLQKARRSEQVLRDTIAVDVRSALRDIDVFRFSLDLQERNVQIAQLGLDSIMADPDRVSVLDQTRAIEELQDARDARDSARRDLELAILDYLLHAGQLRVQAGGTLEPLAGLRGS